MGRRKKYYHRWDSEGSIGKKREGNGEEWACQGCAGGNESRADCFSFSAETFHDASRKKNVRVWQHRVKGKKKKKARMPRIAVHYAEVEVRQQGYRDGEPGICRAEIDPDACDIPGLIVVHDFITVEEEQELLDLIDGGVWDRLARRRVQHYGAKFSYATRTVDTSSNVPRIPEQMSWVGLSPHVDTHSAFGDAIASLSLSEGVSMVFRRDGEQRAVYLPRRSLLVMGGESRWAWEHYIPHRKSDVLVDGHRIQRQKRRVSLTCRSIRHGPCQSLSRVL
eukprot:jgi/Picre1/31705/NNA_007056.t1